ncbi:hypothetical protein HBB16_14635 [Pseudonocardia sp. MCCB 268]|nr:hypothetical protein [Pseudonocardia cytotoxica]
MKLVTLGAGTRPRTRSGGTVTPWPVTTMCPYPGPVSRSRPADYDQAQVVPPAPARRRGADAGRRPGRRRRPDTRLSRELDDGPASRPCSSR